MLIYADEDVPDAVVRFLMGRPHEVQSVRTVFLPGARDFVIAKGASEKRAVVLTCNGRDFKALARRRGKPEGHPAYHGMSLIVLSCRQPRGLSRVQRLIRLIEAAYVILVQEGGGRMIADVGDTVLRFED